MLEKQHESGHKAVKLLVNFIANNLTTLVNGSSNDVNEARTSPKLKPWESVLIAFGVLGACAIIVTCIKKACTRNSDERLQREIEKGDKRIDQLEVIVERQKAEIAKIKAGISEELVRMREIELAANRVGHAINQKTPSSPKVSAIVSMATNRSTFFVDTEPPSLIQGNSLTSYGGGKANLIERKTKAIQSRMEEVDSESKAIKDDITITRISAAQLLEEQNKLKQQLEQATSKLNLSTRTFS